MHYFERGHEVHFKGKQKCLRQHADVVCRMLRNQELRYKHRSHAIVSVMKRRRLQCVRRMARIGKQGMSTQ
jgi:hypothetical protein